MEAEELQDVVDAIDDEDLAPEIHAAVRGIQTQQRESIDYALSIIEHHERSVIEEKLEKKKSQMNNTIGLLKEIDSKYLNESSNIQD